MYLDANLTMACENPRPRTVRIQALIKDANVWKPFKSSWELARTFVFPFCLPVMFVITVFSSLGLPLIEHYFDIKENKLNRQKSNFIYLMRKEWKDDYKASKTQYVKLCFHKIEKASRVKSQKFDAYI